MAQKVAALAVFYVGRILQGYRHWGAFINHVDSMAEVRGVYQISILVHKPY